MPPFFFSMETEMGKQNDQKQTAPVGTTPASNEGQAPQEQVTETQATINLDPQLEAKKEEEVVKKEEKKTVKIELVRDCKVNGKLLLAGSTAMVTEEDAKELCREFDGYYAGWGEGHYDQLKIVRARIIK